jgi:methylenetetrahydrofolate--tRNA-(uracil-5-)-methyltransferase
LGRPVREAIHVIGGGLAGSEAAWQAARAGARVILHEMRPGRATEAHKTARLAELVCSNSFRSDDPLNNAVGLLHEEMRRLGSLIMAAGDAHKLPAGAALAVGTALPPRSRRRSRPSRWSRSGARRCRACPIRPGVR